MDYKTYRRWSSAQRWRAVQTLRAYMLYAAMVLTGCGLLILVLGVMLFQPYPVTKNGACAFVVEPTMLWWKDGTKVECGTYDELRLGAPMTWDQYHAH